MDFRSATAYSPNAQELVETQLVDEEMTGPETPASQHAGVCPNGHDVPPWRATCGVCDLEPIAASNAPPASSTSAPTDEPRSVSKLVWAALAVLAICAIALPLIRHEVVLIEDDFTTPLVLRTWPDDGAALTYADDAYRVSVFSDDSGSSAFHELPHTVGGMTIRVKAESTGADAVVILECVSEVDEVQVPGDASAKRIEAVATYSFALLPNRFLILRKDDALSSGEIPWDGSGAITARCVGDRSGAQTLTLQTDDAEPVEVVDPDGFTNFVGVSLGAYSKSGGSAVTFDDLRVSEAT